MEVATTTVQTMKSHLEKTVPYLKREFKSEHGSKKFHDTLMQPMNAKEVEWVIACLIARLCARLLLVRPPCWLCG